MKKGLIMLFCLGIVINGIGFGGQKEDFKKETVTVVNVEVPVRVYSDGKAVTDLTRDDFKIYEGGKLQKINGFIKKKKKLQVQDLEFNVEKTRSYKSRYFVLVFRITQFNDHIKKGLDYIFSKVVNKSDQLLVFVNNKTAFYDNLSDINSKKEDLEQLIREESIVARSKQLAHVQSIERLINKAKFERMLQNPVSYWWVVEEYFRKFLEVWKEYKKRYLIPDINKYYNFARLLKMINKEKWVINFYQLDVFPDIILNSDHMNHVRQKVGQWEQGTSPEGVSVARMIRRHINQIEKEMSLAMDFPADEVAKLFHNVDATFHSIFMKTTISSLQQDMAYREVASELENSLRSITKLTGGELIVSTNMEKSLEEISNVVDNYYILTYEPDNPDKVGKIKIKLKGHKYKLVYSSNLRFGYLGHYLESKKIKKSPMKIKDLNFKKGKLTFSMADFFMDKGKGGALSVRIRINEENGKSVFDQKKTIKATQKTINISLNFNSLKNGPYDVIVDVTDIFTKSAETGTLKIQI